MAGILHAHPERMTVRARIFMSVVAVRNLALGVSLLAAQRQYGPPNVAFGVVRSAMPIPVWGVLMLLIGTAAAVSAARMSRPWATWAIALSATVSGTWFMCLAVQFATAAQIPGGMSPMLPILWGSLTAKDLVIAFQPMRSPFEPIIQRLLRDEGPTNAPHGEVT